MKMGGNARSRGADAAMSCFVASLAVVVVLLLASGTTTMAQTPSSNYEYVSTLIGTGGQGYG